ncbi:unnamed protein product, partial [Mycena citricolor]
HPARQGPLSHLKLLFPPFKPGVLQRSSAQARFAPKTRSWLPFLMGMVQVLQTLNLAGIFTDPKTIVDKVRRPCDRVKMIQTFRSRLRKTGALCLLILRR